MTTSHATVAPATPDDYGNWTADQKLAWLWDGLISRSTFTPVDLPDLAVPPLSQIPSRAKIVFSTTELSKTLEYTDDLLPAGRPKVIHEFGSAACINMTIGPNSPYTGLLAPGRTSIGLVRMSLAAPPGLRKSFIPGAGLKFLVDGQPSLDLVAVNHTNGQGRNHNLFANPMSHDITDGHNELRLPQRIMAALFRRVSPETRRLRVDHLTLWNGQGHREQHPVTPRRLIFRPRVEAARLFRRHPGEDFRITLRRLGGDSPLFDVVAEDDVYPEPTPIGSISCTSKFVASAGGDRLFFRHWIGEPEAALRQDGE
jgi:hypothetical protein